MGKVFINKTAKVDKESKLSFKLYEKKTVFFREINRSFCEDTIYF